MRGVRYHFGLDTGGAYALVVSARELGQIQRVKQSLRQVIELVVVQSQDS
jgi:hypothetical protein